MGDLVKFGDWHYEVMEQEGINYNPVQCIEPGEAGSGLKYMEINNRNGIAFMWPESEEV